MQYNRHNFKSKQRLTSQQMNEIEQGIVDLVEHANNNDGKLNLTIGTVTSGSTAAATITDGKLNLTLPKGEKGDTGAKGEAGPKGDAGAKGDTGVTPVLTIGSVTTGDAANAIITGTAEAPALNLVLPKGAKGEKGDTGPKGADGAQGQTGAKGDKGDTGATPNLSIGTVTSGTEAAATITGTAEAPVLNLTLPKGEKGDKGDPGSGTAEGGSTATNLSIGTVTSGSTANATIENGKLNLVLPKGDKGDTGDGISEAAKKLLLTLFENAAYKTSDIETTLNALRVEWGGTIETAQLIYDLPSETALSTGFDTGLKLLEHASTETQQYTILLDLKASDSYEANVWTQVVHCMNETGVSWSSVGLNIGINPNNGTLWYTYYRKTGPVLCDTIAHFKMRTRYAIQIDGMNFRGESTHCALSDWNTATVAPVDVPHSLIIGGAREANSSNIVRCLEGTLYQCKVYKGLLSDEKVNKFIQEGTV